VKKDRDPLTLSAERGARLIALDLLDGAADSADRLMSKPDDLNALHDFRVALRRLRSWLRAFVPEFGKSVRPKDRRRLRNLADATNRGRDADVQIAWLERVSQGRSERRTRGAKLLIDQINAERRAGGDPIDADQLETFAKTRTRLIERLSTITEPVRPPDPPPATLAEAIGARLSSHADRLGQTLDAIRSADDEAEVHAARIAAKRLRYLIEPAGRLKGGKAIRSQMKNLQDELGELHDAHVLGQRLLSALEGVSGPDRTGLRAVSMKLRSDRLRIFKRLERRWTRERGALVKLNRRLAKFADRLERNRPARRPHPKERSRPIEGAGWAPATLRADAAIASESLTTPELHQRA
jgi:CHAD domain-containing protein